MLFSRCYCIQCILSRFVALHHIYFQKSGLVTHSESLETASCTSPTASEKQAFQNLLKKAKEEFGERFNLITTDGHIGIAAYMRSKEPAITHNQVCK